MIDTGFDMRYVKTGNFDMNIRVIKIQYKEKQEIIATEYTRPKVKPVEYLYNFSLFSWSRSQCITCLFIMKDVISSQIIIIQKLKNIIGYLSIAEIAQN